MKENTVGKTVEAQDLMVGKLSAGGDYITYGLDEDFELTGEKDPYILMRMSIQHSDREHVYPDVRKRNDERWGDWISRQVDKYRVETENSGAKLLFFAKFLKEQALLYKCHGGNPLALPKKSDGLDPVAVARNYVRMNGCSDIRRMAHSIVDLLGDDPVVIGKASATAYFGDNESIAQCNFIAFLGEPALVGQANAASFDVSASVMDANIECFLNRRNSSRYNEAKFNESMYSSFEGNSDTLVEFLYTAYEVEVGVAPHGFANALKKLYCDDFDSFKKAILYVADNPPLNSRHYVITTMGKAFLHMVGECDKEKTKSLISKVFDTREDRELAMVGAGILMGSGK